MRQVLVFECGRQQSESHYTQSCNYSFSAIRGAVGLESSNNVITRTKKKMLDSEGKNKSRVWYLAIWRNTHKTAHKCVR